MEKDIVNIIIGDSIAYGFGDNEYFGYWNRIRKKIGNYKKEYFFNLSIPGQSSSEIEGRFQKEFLYRYNKIDTFNIFFAFGIKDALKINDNEEHLKVFENNVLEIISFSKQYTDNIYFIGLLDVDLKVKTQYKKQNIELINNTLQSICDNNKVYYIDMKGVVPLNNLIDGLHPNEEGHEKISLFLTDKLYK